MTPMEAFANAASKLESQVVRNLELPRVYREHVSDAFAALEEVRGLLRAIGALRVSGTTEDGRMLKLSNSEGYVVAHVHTQGAADAIVALSRIGGDS